MCVSVVIVIECRVTSQGLSFATYICDRMELNEYNSVGERHQANEHKIHANGDNTQTSIVSNQWLVLSKSVLLDQSGSYCVHEVPVQECVYQHDQDLTTPVPILVYVDEAVLMSASI